MNHVCDNCVPHSIPTMYHEDELVLVNDVPYEHLCSEPPSVPSAWIGNGSALHYRELGFVLESCLTSEWYVRILTGGGGIGWIRESLIRKVG